MKADHRSEKLLQLFQNYYEIFLNSFKITVS